MLARIKGTMIDPITNRAISNACWNGFHDDREFDDGPYVCMVDDCNCMCHGRPQPGEQEATQ